MTMADQKRYGFIYHIIKYAIILLANVPRLLMNRLAAPLGKIWYGIDHYHRRIAFENMTIAFGREKSVELIRQLVRDNFVQLVRVVLEIPSLLKLNKNNVDAYVDIVGIENLRKALAKKKGVLFLTAHFGNWEMMALAASIKYDLNVNVLARPLDFSPLDKFLTEIRSRTGNKVIDKNHSAGMVRQMLRENQMIGILLDQNASPYEGVNVNFFGKTACTNKGLAMFAIRYAASVVPIFNIRLPDGRYRIIIEPPLELRQSGNIRNDIVDNTAYYNRIIERFIRMAPEGWLWVHRRWRIKKPAGTSLQGENREPQ